MKQKLRKKFFQLRQKKYFDLNHNQLSAIFSFLIQLIKRNDIKVIGTYYPIHLEMNINSVLQLLKKKCQVALPLILNNNKMEFRVWNQYDPLYVNKFGILEPSTKNKKVIPQLFLTPLLAFDKHCNRLGYGKGYYDRYLSRNKKALAYGVAFSFQQTKEVPINREDVPLQGIITEKGIVIKK